LRTIPRFKDKSDVQAARLVVEYVIRYAEKAGNFPRVGVGMMRELSGWPVRNADGGSNVAYFTSEDAGNKAIQAAKKEYEATFCVHWTKDIR
jgi:hypothetical protein